MRCNSVQVLSVFNRLGGSTEKCNKLAKDAPMRVRHERKGSKEPDVRNCTTDEGRPLGTGLQEQVSNHPRRLWSKAMVVSTDGKGLARTRSDD